MPTYKHPCPHCDTFIERDVAACPKCGRADPFAPARCPTCRAPVEDPRWVACPKCGTALEPGTKDDEPSAAGATAAPSVEASASAAATCSGCGTALPAGARFCRECGTVVI